MEMSEELRVIVLDTLDKLNAMSAAEFRRALIRTSSTPKCYPHSCQWQCQGQGWCGVAREFRAEFSDGRDVSFRLLWFIDEHEVIPEWCLTYKEASHVHTNNQ